MNDAKKQNVCVRWERAGNCLWHCNCPDRGGIMKPGHTDGDKTLLTCLSCGAATWAQHGMHDGVEYTFPPAPPNG